MVYGWGWGFIWPSLNEFENTAFDWFSSNFSFFFYWDHQRVKVTLQCIAKIRLPLWPHTHYNKLQQKASCTLLGSSFTLTLVVGNIWCRENRSIIRNKTPHWQFIHFQINNMEHLEQEDSCKLHRRKTVQKKSHPSTTNKNLLWCSLVWVILICFSMVDRCSSSRTTHF